MANRRGKVEAVTDFIFLGSKITADSDRSHEITRGLFLGRKVRINLDSMLKRQRPHFADKGPCSQSYGFSSSSMWMWELDYKGRVLNAFELWDWRRLLRVLRIPWTARRSNQSILKEINPEYSLGGLVLMLKLQYFVHLIQKTDLFEKTLTLGKTEGKRKRGRQRMRLLNRIIHSMEHHPLNGHEFEQTLPGDSEGQESLACCSP